MQKYPTSLAALAETLQNLVHYTRGFIFLNFDLNIYWQNRLFAYHLQLGIQLFSWNHISMHLAPACY